MNDKASPNRAYIPTSVEHIANVVTHGVCRCYSIYFGLAALSALMNIVTDLELDS
jgi:hypothetical protein